ncbi:unnamed protein product [Periconia digitata]|uniref:Uncharacterized protein n=1 Tax=Periconia digitata TaxID=1303443 RepID=A0A9W4XSQ1_9PLEO|nr:unnamed protein product [Periconia digitata]
METSYAPIESAHDDQSRKSRMITNGKRGFTTALSHTEDNWLVEIICVALGAVFIAVLCLVLHAYDGEIAPTLGSAFGSSLTLNTIVAIIAAAAKLLLVLPVAECLGQLRWIWFARGNRHLNDFDAFDRAVRGSIWSAFEVLWMTKLRSLVSLGAFITLFAVAIDPLSQQLIVYRTDSKPTDVNATMPIAVLYHDVATNAEAIVGPGWKDLPKGGNLSPTDYSYISIGMKSAVQSGLASGKKRIAELPATCPGGNCTFGDYSSLAVCVSFADVTEHLREVKERILLTDDHYLVRYGGDEDLFDAAGEINISSVATGFQTPQKKGRPTLLNFNQSISFKDLPFPLADMFVITSNGSVPAPPDKNIGTIEIKYAAFEIALSWCIQSYTTQVINGTSITQKLSENRNFTWSEGLYALVNDAPDPGHPRRHWNVDGLHHASLQWYLMQLFSGEEKKSRVARTATSDVAQVLFEPFMDLDTGGPKGNISKQLYQTEREGLRLIFDNVATSMTNRVRAPERGFTVNGTVLAPVTLVHIRWPWITAHACFALFSFCLLVATITSHRASPLRGIAPWKSSGVAILHALDPGLQRRIGGVVKMSEAQELCKGKRVRLDSTIGNKWMLVEVENNK